MSETLLNINQNNINTQDASFTEMIKATQVGKKELAQALIDKGADVTANSTLVEMADATNDLVVQTEASFEYGFIPSEVKFGTNVNFDTTWNGGVFSYCKFKNGNLIICNDNKLYMIDGSLFYEGLNDALTRAKVVYDMTEDGLSSENTSSLHITRSQDGTKIALKLASENVAVSRYIYNVDFDENTISLLRKYDTDYTDGNFQTYNANPSSFCVSNDGRWIHEAHYYYGHFIDTVNDVHTQIEYGYNEWKEDSYYDSQNVLFFFNELNNVFELCSHGGISWGIKYKKLQINEDNTISFSTPLTTKASFNRVYTSRETCQIDLDLNICYTIGHNSGSSHRGANGDYINNLVSLSITDIATGKSCIKYFGTNVFDSFDYYFYNTKYNFLNFKEIEEGIYKIDNPLFNCDNVTFNKNTMEITTDKKDFISIELYYSSSYYNNSFINLIKKDNNSFIMLSSQGFYINYWKGRADTTNPYFLCVKEDTNTYIFGVKLKKNGYETLYRSAAGEACWSTSTKNYLLTKDTTKVEL